MGAKVNIIKIANHFLNMLSENGIRISKAFIFGSHAKGKVNSNSDIDLAVVSPNFSGFRFNDLGLIAPFKIKANTDLEIHPFPLKEFNKKNPLAKEIIENGQRII